LSKLVNSIASIRTDSIRRHFARTTDGRDVFLERAARNGFGSELIGNPREVRPARRFRPKLYWLQGTPQAGGSVLVAREWTYLSVMPNGFCKLVAGRDLDALVPSESKAKPNARIKPIGN